MPWSLLLNPTVLLALALAAASAFGYIQTTRLGAAQDRIEAITARFDQFKAQVASEGKLAQERADSQARADKLKKEKADANQKRATAVLLADIERLRKSRGSPGGGGLSAPAPLAGSPDRTCYDPAKFAGALRSLDEGILGILESGSQAVIDLNSVREWAKSP